ncbi:MAG: SprT family zinc-dependent metalloprotease [Angelakisella sp.]
MTLQYNLIRSKRKTISLCVADDLSIQVRAPQRMPLGDIEQFVEKHTGWIEKQRSVVERRTANPLTHVQVEQLREQAKVLLPQRVAHYSAIMGVVPTGIKVTSATTRWGSCSGRNSLCFPYRIMLLPPELLDYIIVHELAHIRVKNHSKSFYSVVAAYLPDYKARIATLKRIEKELPRSP